MKVLLTGSQGQIGTELRLLGAADPTIDLSATDLAELNITDPRAVESAVAALAPDVVINAAAYTAVDAAEREPELAFAVNETGPMNLARACDQAGALLMHISTDFVFSGEQDTPYREDAATGPVNVYGESKLVGEQAVRENCAHHVILRTAWVVSPWGKNFMKSMLALMEQNQPLRVVSDQVGCPTAAADVAATLLQIARRLMTAGTGRDACAGTYHYCGRGTTTWYDFAAKIAAVRATRTGAQASLTAITTAEYPTPARRPRYSALNCDLLQEKFGISTLDWQTVTEREVLRCIEQESKDKPA